MRKYSIVLALSAVVFLTPLISSAAVLYSQSVALSPGWNVISTPRLLDSHTFSIAENATNFDIYVLDASQTSGWATMSDLGQTEFMPLYGYFIDNKSGANQTLTLNYKSGVAPNDRLFSRSITKTGWYSVGVANPTYAVSAGTTTVDTDNPSHILSALSSNYSTALDLTDGSYSVNQDSVAVADAWKATTASDVASLRDLRETKGYGIYVTGASALYNGFQNNSLPQCMDGIDNDNDGKTDYPADTSCLSKFGNDESVTPPIIASLSVANATGVASQNIQVSVPNQVLGGFTTTISGEAVTVQTLTFDVATTSSACTSSCLLQNVSLVDSNGSVVAGPVNATWGVNKQTLAFSSAVTLPTGTHTYTLKGTVPSGEVNSETYVVSTNPSTGWTGATGQTTGNAVSLTDIGSFSMNTMTVKTASLAMSLSASPSAQTIVAGGQSVLFANVQLDASQSGEDVRVNSIPLHINQMSVAAGSATTNISACALYDSGGNSLNFGSNIVNSFTDSATSTSASTNAKTFSLNNSLTIPKGTVVTLALKCNVSSSAIASDSYQFTTSAGDTVTFTGATSGNSSTVAPTQSDSGTQTISGPGTVSVSIDAASPSYAIASGGTTGATVGVVKFRPSIEAMNLTKVGLTLVNGTYGATGAQDIVTAYIYNGATLVGTATFTGSNTTATSTLFSVVTLPKDTDTTLRIKADLADIGTSQPGTEGDLIKIDVANYEGSGVSSGSTIRGSATMGVAGVRLLNTFPTIAQGTLPSTSAAAGRLIRFTVTANSQGDVGIHHMTFSVATSSGVTITGAGLYAYTDSGYSTPVSGQGSGGLIGSTADVNSTSDFVVTVSDPNSPIEVPAGSTYYFELRGTVGGTVAGSSITTTLKGDSAFSGMLAALNVAGNFVWSPNATAVTVGTVADWTNSYGVIGLPSSGFTQSVTQ